MTSDRLLQNRAVYTRHQIEMSSFVKADNRFNYFEKNCDYLLLYYTDDTCETKVM